MKSFFLVICFFFCSTKIFSQDLEGEWKGSYSHKEPYRIEEVSISFIFSKTSDSTYQAISKTFIKEGKHTDSSVCLLEGFFSKKAGLELKEIKMIKDFDNGQGCLQTMKFIFYKRKKQLVLSGEWYTQEDKCGYGTIFLTKSY